jgi:hypothetical protein
MSDDSIIEFEFLPDGSVKINASKMKGSEAQIKDFLEELAKGVGGELVVEKHVEGAHHHHHHDHRLSVKGGGHKH